MDDELSNSQSLKLKLKQSLCLSCCFRNNRRGTLESPSSFDDKPRLIRASSMWLKSRAHELPEIGDKCRNLISRIGRQRKHSSTDFRYDPLSYALNFDGGGYGDDSHLDEAPLRNFSSRLPASPRMAAMDMDCVVAQPPVAVPREIAAFS